MSAYDKTFEWIDFPQGRVRYAGGAANREEPREAFAVDLHGQIYYGEIKKAFLPDRHNYNLEIISFGWLENGWYGILPEPELCAAFVPKDLETVQTLLCQAVEEWRKLEDRPFTEYSDSHFMGDVLFRDGWALIKDEGAAS